MGREGANAYARLAVTLALPIVALVAARITLPGVDTTVLQLAGSFDPTVVGILAIEVNPTLSAFLYVEVLALLIPRWRRWRVGGYPERASLWTRVVVLAVPLTALQAFFVARWLTHTSHSLPPPEILAPGWSPFVAVILTLTAGSLALVWLARLIERKGCGSGFAVFAVGFTVPEMVGGLMSSARHQLELGERILLPLLLAAVVLAGVTRLAGGKTLRSRPGGLETVALPVPACGLLAVTVTRFLLDLPVHLGKLGVDFGRLGAALAPGSWSLRATQAALVAVFTVAIAALFNRPRAVAAVWIRAGAADAGAPAPSSVHERVRVAFARSLAWSLAVGWALIAAEWVSEDARLDIRLLGWTALACLAADVLGELRFRLAHGAVAGVFPVHRLYVLPVMLAALDRAGIRSYPRGRRFRTLWHFFAPQVPVEILVPVEQASQADSLVGQLLAQG
jgi:preprotein translocase subunit SecY